MTNRHLVELYGKAVDKIGLGETVVRAAKHKGLSLAEICRRRGIARGTMYRNFESRNPSIRVQMDYYWALFIHETAQELMQQHEAKRLGLGIDNLWEVER